MDFLKKFVCYNKRNHSTIYKKECNSFERINNIDNDIEWVFDIKNKIVSFLNYLKSEKRKGFIRYSLSGDILSERFKWGLGNCVFFLKIIYTLRLEQEFYEDIKFVIKYILSFQKKNGCFYDPYIHILNFFRNIHTNFKNMTFLRFFDEKVKNAETRQVISSLNLFNYKPRIQYEKIPHNERNIENFLERLNWKYPWGAGSHFSHLLFFLNNSTIKNRKRLINYSIDWVNKLQHAKDGFWYKGNPTIQQKINGAMKIITGLKAANLLNINYPKKIIDSVLLATNNNQACDNFNIVYVLKHCIEKMKHNYRYEDIKDFMLDRLNIYKKYYFPKFGAFSFHLNHANIYYYGAPITFGKMEPDIHGTCLFLWGICQIAKVLKINDKLDFKEFNA